MPEKATVKRAERDKRAGKASTTQAGEFVREEMHHIRQGKHGARSTKQAIAIGLSKARRSGVKLPRPPASAKAKTKQSAKYASRAAAHGRRRLSPRRSRAISRALKRESRGAAAPGALARQARSRPASIASLTKRRGAQSRTDQRSAGASCGGAQGRANAPATTRDDSPSARRRLTSSRHR